MDRDILFAVKNCFYIGAYEAAIEEASDMEGLTPEEAGDKDAFVFRSHIGLGSYDVRARLTALAPGCVGLHLFDCKGGRQRRVCVPITHPGASAATT